MTRMQAQQSKGIGTHKPDQTKRDAEVKAMPDIVHKAIAVSLVLSLSSVPLLTL